MIHEATTGMAKRRKKQPRLIYHRTNQSRYLCLTLFQSHLWPDNALELKGLIVDDTTFGYIPLIIVEQVGRSPPIHL